MLRALPYVGVLLLVALAYHGVVGAGFVYEDANWLPLLTGSLRVTPHLPLWTLQLDAALGGSSPVLFHLTNVVLHVGNAALVWRLAVVFGLSPLGAVLAGYIFLFDPLQTSAVAYISGRPDLVATGLALVCILAARAACAGSRWALLGCLVAGALAVEAKASSVFLAPAVGWTILTDGRRGRHGWLALLAIPPAVVAYLATPLGVDTVGTTLTFAGQQAAAIWHLTGLSVVAWSLSLDHDYALVPAALGIAAIVGLVVSAAWAWTLREDVPAVAWAIGFVVCFTGLRLVAGPAFFAPQLAEYLNEKQFYGAMPALAILAGVGIQTLLQHAGSRRLASVTA